MSERGDYMRPEFGWAGHIAPRPEPRRPIGVVGMTAIFSLAFIAMTVGMLLVLTGIAKEKAPTHWTLGPAAPPGIVVAPTQAETRPGITTEGTLMVGSEVAPGSYAATVPTGGSACYWARLRSLDGGHASIIANGLALPGEHVKITIARTDRAFQTDGCGVWTRI